MMSLATKHDDPQASLGWPERIGYGTGQLGINMINAILGSFMLVYFTNVSLMDAAVVSSIVAISKVFDGVSDLIMGNLVDRTKSKMGKGRVWLLRMCIPFAVSTVLLFFLPQSAPDMVKYVYVFIMYNVVNAVCFTAMFVPYASMVSLITANPYERGMLGNISQIFSTLANVLINAFFLKMLTFYGGGESGRYTQRAFTLTIVTVGIIVVVLSLLCVISTKERVHEDVDRPQQEKDSVSSMEAVKSLLHNKYWIILTICMFAVFFTIIMFSVAAVYYSQYVMGDVEAFSWLSNSVSIAQFAIMFATPLFMKKFGKHKVYTAGIALVCVGFVGFAFAGNNVLLMAACNALKGLGMGAAGGMSLGMVADTITYGEWKTGIRAVGMGNAGISAAQKLGMGLGTAVMGWIMTAGKFDGALEVQPDSAVAAIKFCYTWLPLILMGITLVLMLFFYHIEEELATRN